MISENSIPKRIFYVWLGGKKSANNLLKACCVSWQQTNPSYSITEVNEEHMLFSKALENEYFRICYERGFWAFASDYLRMLVLYEEGGVYVDTDMMLIKPLGDLQCACYFGLETLGQVSVGIVGAIPKNPFIGKILDFYNNDIMHSPLYTIPSIATYILKRDYGFTGFSTVEEEHTIEYNDVTIYSREYFYPYYCNEQFSLECITKNTYGVHFWNDSWSATKFWVKNKHLSPFKRFAKGFSQWFFQMSVSLKKRRIFIKLCGITVVNISAR